MLKWILLVLAVVGVCGFIILRFVYLGKMVDSNVANTPQEVPLSTESGQLTKQVNDVLNKAKTPVETSVANQTSAPGSTSALEARVKVLETALTDVRQQLRLIQQNVTTSNTVASTTSTSKPPIYLPIGAGGASTSPTYQSIYGVEITIDPANYPGYTSVTLESSLMISQQGQTAYARLYNVTDNSPLANSTVSTQSYQNFALVTSANTQLVSGSKTYRLQLSSSGNEADNQFARLRINF